MPSRLTLVLPTLLALLFTTTGTAQITDALGVRSLTAEQAKEGRPVRIRGTVGFVESPGTVFIQDATAGTFFRTKQPLGDLREGDMLEAQGKTFPGLYVPGIEIESFKVVAHGEPPKPQPASYDDLASARFHYQRVSIEGIVRSVSAPDENRSVMWLGVGSRVIEVRVEAPVSEAAPLVDARVQVEGLAAGAINDLRQLVQPYVKLSGWQAVSLIEPARADSEVPLVTAANLLRFSATGESGHRVRVLGTVTGVFKDGLVFLQEEQASIAVRLDEAATLQVGDQVSVEGFPEMDRFTPTLENAHLVNAEKATAPVPHTMKIKEMSKLAHDGNLITISGQVIDSYRSNEGQTFVLLDGDQRLPAHLQGDASLTLAPRSQVQLTGICRVESASGNGFNSRPLTFSLWLRSPQDARLLESPPTWTVERLLAAVGILAAVILVGMIWILLLRRQVFRQTQALRVRIEHEAALEERQRIAREFHDTLEQELAGLSIRMDAAVTRPLDDKARSLLEASRGLVSRIQAEARNLVSDLRDDPDANTDLALALHDLASRQPPGAPEVLVDVDATLPVLPTPVIHHLRMIAREAVTNILKHAQAKHLTLRLHATAEALELSVIDDGVGFDSQTVTQGKAGHFGCMGIRERCRKIGASVRWLSQPQQGTVLEVRLPR